MHNIRRSSLIVTGFVFLSLSFPVMAADIEQDASGRAGDTGAAGERGADGDPAVGIWGDGYSFVKGNTGGDGKQGTDAGDGTDGLDGGALVIHTQARTGSIDIAADGGDGGNGGKGGTGGTGGAGRNVVASTVGLPLYGGDGGVGGLGGPGGNGGVGGKGGSIDLVVDHAVRGNVVLSASGGQGGSAGTGGDGGTGGKGGSASTPGTVAQGGTGGAGGDGATGGSGGQGGPATVPDFPSFATQGTAGDRGDDIDTLDGTRGIDGAGGSITVALSARVRGNLDANAGTGTIDITLNPGASVRRTVSANEEATSVLTFALEVKNLRQFEAAKSYLGNSANAISGSVRIGGKTYTWTGFDQLVESLTLAEIRPRLTSSTTEVADAPVYLSCSPRTVRAVYKDGVIELIARRSSSQPAFQIGRLDGGVFTSQNAFGWTVRPDTSNFHVLDGTGAIVATCRT